ncbi:DUF523 domain-containing protein [uncultured Sphaerochaeta sp.]|uniref:DUF523 domain-containing protein n=1 Tax=uncultured Sphaerochaeta sp. TaxID=886478 RepID=UPI002A0A14AD|nr:DUF523 domain-containing protein [uncultured Sphaerochaeta sp.]
MNHTETQESSGEGKQTILVSACLLGICCRYDGTDKTNENVCTLKKQYHLVPVCPEVYGGLATPREPSERKDGLVVSRSGIDVTLPFEKGAQACLKLAKLLDCKFAILKERSPSCGHGEIYDGSFSGKVIAGNGVCAELLLEHDIRILGETEIGDDPFFIE